MSLLTSSTYAGPDEPLWAVAGSGGGGGGISSVTASGAGITATTTAGAVTVANTGVTSMVAGSGVSVSGPSGAVTVANTGVTSLVAGAGITLSGATGAVTIDAPGTTGAKTSSIWIGGAFPQPPLVTQFATDMVVWGPDSSVPALFTGWIPELTSTPNTYIAVIANPAWNTQADTFFFNVSFAPGVVTRQRVQTNGSSGVSIIVDVTYDGTSPKRIAGWLARFPGFPITVVP
jgi:hypothetical protein